MNPRAADIRAAGRNSLKNYWGIAIGICIVSILLQSAASGVTFFLGGIGGLIIAGPLLLGMISFFCKRALNLEAEFEVLFSYFKILFKSLGLLLFISLFVFLWSLLFFIPGIIASYKYSQAFYLMAQYPEMGIREAVNKSKELMAGNKWRLFCLDFSFIGWHLLATLTLGLLYIWLTPYICSAHACFYMHLTGRIMQDNGGAFNAENGYSQYDNGADNSASQNSADDEPSPETI